MPVLHPVDAEAVLAEAPEQEPWIAVPAAGEPAQEALLRAKAKYKSDMRAEQDSQSLAPTSRIIGGLQFGSPAPVVPVEDARAPAGNTPADERPVIHFVDGGVPAGTEQAKCACGADPHAPHGEVLDLLIVDGSAPVPAAGNTPAEQDRETLHAVLKSWESCSDRDAVDVMWGASRALIELRRPPAPPVLPADLLAAIAEIVDQSPAHYTDCDRFQAYDYNTRQGKCDCTFSDDLATIRRLLAEGTKR